MSKIVSLEKLALFSLALFIAIAGLYSYNSMSLLMPIMTLILLWQQGGIKNSSFYIPLPFVFLFLLLFWGGISFFWAAHPSSSLNIFITMVFTCIFSLVLMAALLEATPGLILKIYTLLKIAGFILIFLIIFQNVMDELHIKIVNLNKYKEASYIYMMKPSGSILGVSAFVSCGMLWVYKSKILSISTFVLLVLLIYLTRCQTAFYGILLACLVFLFSYAAPFWITRLALISSYTFVILSPFLYLYVFPFSSAIKVKWVLQNRTLFHRLLGWDFLSEKVLEHPLVGWGLGATPYLPTKPELAQGYANVTHPHNSGIQAYVELGLVGGILVALLFSSFFWLVEKHVKDRLSVAVCNATLAFVLIQAEVTHSLWHNYWTSWMALIAGLTLVFLKARAAQLHAEAGHSKPIPAS